MEVNKRRNYMLKTRNQYASACVKQNNKRMTTVSTIATEGMIYQVLSEQSDVKGQKFSNIKK